MAIIIYFSNNCEPCKRVKEALANQDVDKNINLVDIDTDEGFKQFYQEVISQDDGFVPSAYQNGKKCQLSFDEDSNLVIDCPDDTT